MYTPKSRAEILQDLKGLVIAQSPLTDVVPGSVLSNLLNAFATELSATESSILAVREGFSLQNAYGAELDERVAELPPVGITRLSAAPASGAVLRVTRSSSAAQLVLPAGSEFSSDNGTTYFTTLDNTFAAGQTTLTGVYCVSTTTGGQTNADVGAITNIVSAPDSILSVTNDLPLNNGSDEESDDSLRSRAMLYLSSLSKTLPSSLRYLALSFIAENGERMRFASIFEDIAQPGYTELVVDDGSGLTVESVSQFGYAVSGITPQGGYQVMFHEAPATAPMTTSNITVTRGGSPVSLSAGDFTSVPERGIVYFKQGVLQAGDQWQISGYRVYRGFIAELQRQVEGNYEDGAVLTGFRPAGTRVVVCPATPTIVRFDVALTVELGYDYTTVEQQVLTTLRDFISSLAPGEPLFTSAMIEEARAVSGVRDILFYGRGTTTYLQNVFPESKRHALRIDSSSITITASATV